MENGKRRQLTPEEKWEVFLEVTSQELSQADAARKWGVDVSVIIRLRALAKENLRFGTVPASVSGEASRSGFSFSSGTLRGPRIVAPRSLRIGSDAPFPVPR